jgi:omega-amidase
MKVSSIHIATRETAQETVKVALELVQQAQSEGADLIVLPELFAVSYRLHEAALAGEIKGAFQAATQGNNTVIVAGMLEHAASSSRHPHSPPIPVGRPYERQHLNQASVFAGGSEVACYTKNHLIPAFHEPTNMIPGNRLVMVEVAGCKVAVSICFDLRFPELFRSYGLQGAEVFVVPSAWPASRGYAWELFCKSRAAENQAYLISANHAEEPFGVASFAIDYMGMEMARLETEGVLTVEFDPAPLRKLREDFPVFQQRRPDLYGQLVLERVGS